LQGNALCGGKGPWELQIGSPMLEEFVQNFVIGLFESAELTLASQGIRAEFRIERVETLPTPKFRESSRFKCLSPIAVSTMHERQGRLQPYYYRPHDAGLSEALRKNLLEKYQIIHDSQKATFSEKVAFSLKFRLEPHDKPKSKLITIKEGSRQATHIKAFETYFTLEGSPELMQVAWECGLGERNSQGFGMVELVNS
jgi:CRISPR-associated endoribonuclease Cas6